MSVILLTGSSGFIGRRVAAACRSAGLAVRCTGRSPCDSISPYFRCDLAEGPIPAGLFRGVETVVHAAGLAHQFRTDTGTESAFQEANTRVTDTVFRESLGHGVRHFVFLSSVSVYGSGGDATKTEASPCNPIGPYAVSKYQAEQRLMRLASESDCRLTVLRLATVYGEGDAGNVNRLMRSIDRGRFVWIGDGENRKTLLHVDDAARACIHAIRRTNASRQAVYNVGALPCRMRDIVTALEAALGKSVPRLQLPVFPVSAVLGTMAAISGRHSRFGRIEGTLRTFLRSDAFDSSSFYRECDFQPSVELRAGIARQVASYLHNDHRQGTGLKVGTSGTIQSVGST